MKITRLVMSHSSALITENIWQVLKAKDHSLLDLTDPKTLCKNGCCPVIIEHARRVIFKKAG